MKKVFIIDDHSLFVRALKYWSTVWRLRGEFHRSQRQRTHPPPPGCSFAQARRCLAGCQNAGTRWPGNHDLAHRPLPEIPVLALSMEDEDLTVIQMLRKGVKGLPAQRCQTWDPQKRWTIPCSLAFTKTKKGIQSPDEKPQSDQIRSHLKEKEIEFIRLCCSELTYKEIATVMNLSPKTVDGYREAPLRKTRCQKQGRAGDVCHQKQVDGGGVRGRVLSHFR